VLVARSSSVSAEALRPRRARLGMLAIVLRPSRPVDERRLLRDAARMLDANVAAVFVTAAEAAPLDQLRVPPTRPVINARTDDHESVPGAEPTCSRCASASAPDPSIALAYVGRSTRSPRAAGGGCTRGMDLLRRGPAARRARAEVRIEVAGARGPARRQPDGDRRPLRRGRGCRAVYAGPASTVDGRLMSPQLPCSWKPERRPASASRARASPRAALRSSRPAGIGQMRMAVEQARCYGLVTAARDEAWHG